ncbi:uncharacterized protein LOC143231817 [Tachypleus tridentatus]|uniref:uncharacterized protein LOC143231817 n=1 Tax=Tachypleus tridentatus TaxID=6853 RepID=UPI003FD348F2
MMPLGGHETAIKPASDSYHGLLIYIPSWRPTEGRVASSHYELQTLLLSSTTGLITAGKPDIVLVHRSEYQWTYSYICTFCMDRIHFIGGGYFIQGANYIKAISTKVS